MSKAISQLTRAGQFTDLQLPEITWVNVLHLKSHPTTMDNEKKLLGSLEQGSDVVAPRIYRKEIQYSVGHPQSCSTWDEQEWRLFIISNS